MKAESGWLDRRRVIAQEQDGTWSIFGEDGRIARSIPHQAYALEMANGVKNAGLLRVAIRMLRDKGYAQEAEIIESAGATGVPLT